MSPSDPPKDLRGPAREEEGVIRPEELDYTASERVAELDEGRYRQLKGGEPDDIEPGDLLRGNTVFQFIAYWMLSYVQARLGDEFDVTPGADMLAAVETAEEHGIDVALVDRDINETMRRFWSQMGIVEKFRMVGGLAFGLADSRGVGLAAGAVLGLLLGPLVAIFGGSVGLGLPVLGRITGGVLLAVGVAAAIWIFGASVLSTEDRLVAATAAGIAIGGVAGVGLGLAALVGGNLALTYLAWTQPAACGLGESSSGVLASLPAALSGTACCGPVVLIALGIQASGALLTAFQFLLPVSALLLAGSLVLVGRQIGPQRD